MVVGSFKKRWHSGKWSTPQKVSSKRDQRGDMHIGQ